MMKLDLWRGGSVFCALLCAALLLGGAAVAVEAIDAADPLLIKAATLAPQSGEGVDIRTAFNQNVDRVRLMVLLSPT